jgi:hypothetical protein
MTARNERSTHGLRTGCRAPGLVTAHHVHGADRGANVAAGREDGGIITGWLLQLLMILAVISLLVYEVVAVGVARVALDDTARDVARVARDTYRAERSLGAARTAAEDAVADGRADIVALDEVEGELVVTLSEQARTLLLHRVAPLEDLATATATRRVGWRS